MDIEVVLEVEVEVVMERWNAINGMKQRKEYGNNYRIPVRPRERIWSGMFK